MLKLMDGQWHRCDLSFPNQFTGKAKAFFLHVCYYKLNTETSSFFAVYSKLWSGVSCGFPHLWEIELIEHSLERDTPVYKKSP